MIGLTGRILYISGLVSPNYRWVVFSEFATLLFGATVFLFTRSSLTGETFDRRDLAHYVPALIYNILVTFFFILPDDTTLAARTESGMQYTLILVFVGVGLCINITYWALSLKCFLTARNRLGNEVSHAIKTGFFLHFLMAIGLCMAIWLSLYLMGLLKLLNFDRLAWQLVWMSIALVILFITFYSIKTPEVFKVARMTRKKKYAHSKLTVKDMGRLKVTLEQLMEEKKPYLNQKLMKEELAELLGVSKPEIARLLNEHIGMNFFQFVNYYRIKEFIALAKTRGMENLTLYGLAQEAGFNSKTTFNKAFKDIMGITPKKYFQNS
ncbi:MAG: helix-turn-helix domain-containing protein [Flavobacteriaceae bacterium]